MVNLLLHVSRLRCSVTRVEVRLEKKLKGIGSTPFSRARGDARLLLANQSLYRDSSQVGDSLDRAIRAFSDGGSTPLTGSNLWNLGDEVIR